jgi:hypothetical protein
MPAPPPQFQYKMQRASTQLSINLQQPPQLRANLHKNYGSSHDLKMPDKSIERRQEKIRESKKINENVKNENRKGRAPPPPTSSNSRIKVRLEN